MSSTRPSATGKLIVFEGPDGVGKSTLSRLAAERLLEAGHGCDLVTFPGKEPGTLGRLVYDLHHEPGKLGVNSLTETARQTLHIAAHIDLIERLIAPRLRSGRHILLDRYWWSTWVYGIAGRLDRRALSCLINAERALWGRLRPALVLLIQRPEPLNRPDELPDRWRMVATEYRRLRRVEAGRYPIKVVQNVGRVADALQKVLALCNKTLGLPRAPPGERQRKGAPSPAVSAAVPTATAQLPDAPTLLSARQLEMAFATARPTSPPRSSPSRDDLEPTSQRAADGLRGRQPTPTVLTHLLPAKPTVVFDTYWRFAAERQDIFFRRAAGGRAPWTTDPILSQFKFTNAYRASDRVSQYLIRHVIYRDDLPSAPHEIFFRILLFKVFNRIETWQLLERAIGPISFASYSFETYDRLLGQASERGLAIYSAAYIMPTGGRGSGDTRKHRMHLRLIERMMMDELPKKLGDAPSMHAAFDLLLAYPTIGDFLAYQFVTDINYSTITAFSEMDFVVPGPGARDGIRKCFSNMGGLNEPEIIRLMADRQEREFERLGLRFKSLWGRRLQLIDCQNLFCEVDKYARVAHPEYAGLSGRSRIKQRFKQNNASISYSYPPKWGLNEKIAADSLHADDSPGQRPAPSSGPLALFQDPGE